MNRHLYALAVTMILLTTGCNNSATLDNTATTELPEVIAHTVEAPEPKYGIGSNNLGSEEAGGNFYLEVDYGPIGHVSYDVQYDNTGKYTGTFVYSYLADGQEIDDFITKTDIPIDVADVTYITDSMYFCFLTENGLKGFDESLEQTAMYNKLCEEYGLTAKAEDSSRDDFYLLAEPAEFTISAGEYTTIIIKHAPDGYDGTYTYEVADSSIVTIDNEGAITGVSAGETTILVATEDGNNSCQFTITVQ